MQTVDERPAHTKGTEAEATQVQTPVIQPGRLQYVPFEESFWSRYRALIWTFVILLCLGIGAVALILPAFTFAC
jgi:hypothetical protein